jgi:hypothetical protein
MLNGAIWIGATFHFALFIGPAIFSDKMLQVFGWPASGLTAKYYSGLVAQALLPSLFSIQFICAIIGFICLIIDWIYNGRPLKIWLVGITAVLCIFAWEQSAWVHPKLAALHSTMYGIGGMVTVEQAQQATKDFHLWHGLSQAGNFLALAGAAVFMWHWLPVSGSVHLAGPTKYNLK